MGGIEGCASLSKTARDVGDNVREAGKVVIKKAERDMILDDRGRSFELIGKRERRTSS